MINENRHRLTWGFMLLIGALGSASMRNNPALGISPFAVGVIEAIIYVCILAAVHFSDWRMAAVIAVCVPVYLWIQRFFDGFMIPVEVLVNFTLLGCMKLAHKKKWNRLVNVLLLTFPAFFVMLLGSTAVISLVKKEQILHSLMIAWNTDVLSFFGMLGAALLCAPFVQKKSAQSR